MAFPINLKGTGMELTGAIKIYADEKVVMLEKFIDPEDTSVRADIELEKTTGHHKSGDVFRAEINLHLAGDNLRAEYTGEDLYAAIDGAKDAMARELRSRKNKHKTLEKKGGGMIKRLLRGFRSGE